MNQISKKAIISTVRQYAVDWRAGADRDEPIPWRAKRTREICGEMNEIDAK